MNFREFCHITSEHSLVRWTAPVIFVVSFLTAKLIFGNARSVSASWHRHLIMCVLGKLCTHFPLTVHVIAATCTGRQKYIWTIPIITFAGGVILGWKTLCTAKCLTRWTAHIYLLCSANTAISYALAKPHCGTSTYHGGKKNNNTHLFAEVLKKTMKNSAL